MPSARGTLPWHPAVDHLDLLAPPVAAAIRAVDGALVAPIDAALADTAAFCAAYDVAPEASANCVIVAGRRGDVATYAAVMVLATDRADVNGIVRRHLGVRRISFAANGRGGPADRHGVRRDHPRRPTRRLARARRRGRSSRRVTSSWAAASEAPSCCCPPTACCGCPGPWSSP